MLYNRFKEHVVNDKKKMYKRGSQWVVASAFVVLFGGTTLGVEAQPVEAATSGVANVTLSKNGNASQKAPVAQQSQQNESQASKVATPQSSAEATVTGKADDTVVSSAAVQNTAIASSSSAAATYAAASTANNPGSSSASSSMTQAEWQAQKAKYDQAKSSAAASEAAAKAQAENAKSSYADQITQQAEAQKEKDGSAFDQLQASGSASLAAMQSSQASSYAAASQAADKTIADLNAQRQTSNIPVGDGGTLNYVAKTGSWTNIATTDDAKQKTWNGNFLIQNLPVFSNEKSNSVANMTDKEVMAYYDEGGSLALSDYLDNINTPAWALTDTVKNNTLSAAQKLEVNQYGMMLVNNYRKALGLDPVASPTSFLTLVQERGDSMLGDTEMHHDTGILDRIFGGHWAGECLASQDPAFYQQNYKGKRSGDLTMIEVLQSESDSINGLFNDDTDQNQGHRNILLSDGAQAGGFSYQKTAGGGWVLNYNDSYDTFSGENTATVPDKISGITDNNQQIDLKIAKVKDGLNDLKSQQTKDYQTAYSAYVDAQKVLYAKITKDDALLDAIPQMIKENNEKQDAAVDALIKKLDAQVSQLDPGPEPTSGAGSSASSAGSSASSSASSSSASSAGSSTSSSASSSSASSSGSSASSSASSSSASSAGSSASSSASSSSASSSGSSASSSASSSSASSTGSSASSSASSSSASSAGTTAASSTSSSSTSSAAVATLGTTQSTNPQPMSRMAQKNGKHAYPATGEGQTGLLLAEAGAVIIAVLGFAGVRKARHAK
ncbi:SEC10/PgrA surface exclusion domain-containing protein [Lacticaseibacillus rhamnosus]|uniref:SEC10/PgrA surface exclusion domain-containing protein n=1 Tax=Lacticaseibacillus rhamnosus TaxID=47715 RepID=UPI000667F85C|nr:SEC10/PgrA surface exclusion domain-containing protein [Lacticaseibacillus rhamnosus]WHM89379.1 SEC10/PgrA surface exclusion domain-containing protein [Lacticaseibacillus rhamnosus]